MLRMIRYNRKIPGGDSIISTIIRFWWMFINRYHTCRWLIAQSFASRRFVLNRNDLKLRGETAVITGGSRGIGSAVVRKLLQYDMHVIIGCRSRTATNNMVKAIRRKGVTSGTVQAISLDLSSLNSIREFAYKVMKKDVKISVLINNAAVRETSYGLTVEENEHHFQINYLSHVLLTYMLLPKLHWSAKPEKCSRIINVSSTEHYGAYPDLNDVHMQTFYSPDKAYMDTKLLLIAWSGFLDRKLQQIGANIRSYSVHPGFVKTEMWNQVGWVDKIGPLHHLFFEKCETAADSIVYASLSPNLEGSGGVFLSNNEFHEPHPLCKDEKFQNKLWKLSCKILKLEENELAPIAEIEEDSDEEENVSETEDDGLISTEYRIHNKNQNQFDLDFMEEFDLNSETSCGYNYKYFEPCRSRTRFPYKGMNYGSDCSRSISEPSPCFINTAKPNSGFIASFKHSFKFNFNLKIFKNFSLPSLTRCSNVTIKEKKKFRKPYYEYFINSIFNHWNLNKSYLRYLENVSIFVLRRLDRINSQFKLVQTLVKNE